VNRACRRVSKSERPGGGRACANQSMARIKKKAQSKKEKDKTPLIAKRAAGISYDTIKHRDVATSPAHYQAASKASDIFVSMRLAHVKHVTRVSASTHRI